jgi:hypothetical protein
LTGTNSSITPDADDASHFIFKNVPEGYEFESARSLGGVISGTAAAALWAYALTALARYNLRNNVLRHHVMGYIKGNFAEAEGLVIRYRIEYSFQKHLGRIRKNEVVENNILYRRVPRCLYLVPIDSGGVPIILPIMPE